MKYWLTIRGALVKMLIRLRLIIADLALFYAEKSLKSERTFYLKLETHLFSSLVHCPKNMGFSTIPVFFVLQPEISPRSSPPRPLKGKILNSGKGRAVLSLCCISCRGERVCGYSSSAEYSCNDAIHLGGKSLPNTQPSPAKCPEQRWCARP